MTLEADLGAGSAPSSHGVELAAYRIVQESLTNCLKHSGASAATVRITRDDGVLDIRIQDDGTGAGALPTGRDSPGLGLAGMRERVAIYGGELLAGSSPTGGYSVHARIPLSASAPIRTMPATGSTA